MNSYVQNIFFYLTLIGLFSIVSCEENQPIAPVGLNFTNTELGISESSEAVDVSITFSRAVDNDGSIVLSLTSDLIYGDDFLTEPTASESIVELFYSAGDESISFRVLAGPLLNIDQDESLMIMIDDPDQLFELGTNSSVEILFSENFIAPSGTANLNAGGPEFTHQSFFDLSKIVETRLEKASWHLGFSSMQGEHKVYLNNSIRIMASPTDKNDLLAVSSEDINPLQSFSTFQADPAWVDAPDLSTLAIGDISATDAENVTYLISNEEGTETSWTKVRILQNGEGYIVQHAEINDSSFETVEITKNESYPLTLFSFETGDVSATNSQPAPEAWDLRYGTFTNVVNFGSELPYHFNDFIIINTASSAAQVLIDENLTYESFSDTDLSSLTFDSSPILIGSSWRQGGGPGQAPSLLEDRFYVIQDGQENVYKLKFTSMTSSEGERGHAEVIYELLQ